MESVAIYVIKKKEVKMPGFNKTGPTGQGPQTGRRMGSCAESENNQFSFGSGRGFGRGRRRWFGFFGSRRRNRLNEENSIENEIDFLKNQISMLEKLLTEK